MADDIPAPLTAGERPYEVASDVASDEDMHDESNEAEDANGDEDDDEDDDAEEDAEDDADEDEDIDMTAVEEANRGPDEGVTAVRKVRKPHHKSRNGCRECKRLRQKCDEAKPSCGYCTKRHKICDYTLPPAKRRGPKPKAPHERPWKEPKPISRPKVTYNLKRKQEVLLWLIHHRVEDVESDIPGRATTAKWREGEAGCVEKDPRIMPDGSKKWMRAPTYHEASKFWKVSASTLTSWWKKRKEILGGEVPQPEIPLVHPSERAKPIPPRPVSPGPPHPPWRVGEPLGAPSQIYGLRLSHGQQPPAYWPPRVPGPPQIAGPPLGHRPSPSPVHRQPPASGLDSALQQAQRLANEIAGLQAAQLQAAHPPPGQVLHPLYRAGYTVDAVHREVTSLVRAPQAIQLDSLMRAIGMAHDLVAHLNESHKALMYPQAFPQYYHPTPGYPRPQRQHASSRPQPPPPPPPTGPHTQPPPRARHVAQGQPPRPTQQQQAAPRASQQFPPQGPGPQQNRETIADQRAANSDERTAAPPAPETSRPESAYKSPSSPSKVPESAAAVADKNKPDDEETQQRREDQGGEREGEREKELEVHDETAPQLSATDEPANASEAADGAARSSPDGTPGQDDANDTSGHAEDADVSMTLNRDDAKATQEGAAVDNPSDGSSSGSGQEDRAMTEDSDPGDGQDRDNEQDEGGDTVMADAPAKDAPAGRSDKDSLERQLQQELEQERARSD
ncbi:hypothetical protein SLS53_005443 [Cytospora paraplurivora]|uniref:Zn(2)-C6 fungal-type domain-containing protein n=1 Tax=Cytospora paraplurivora TaxID=2898453 RepID=A0AAN9U5P6_9PEZI